ncbi:hypothetical protein GCM10009745_09010 [Kribbella yunnanensis]|uniref:Uncharacterized protein n=1 Tax=Kribbella yunnanensis TaxID=190194 RepID=A0ABP4S7X6_9ACTN
MSTPKEDLHALVDEIPDDAAAELLPDVSAIVRRRLELRRRNAGGHRSWPPSWFAAGAGSSPDVAARSEEILRDEFGQRS